VGVVSLALGLKNGIFLGFDASIHHVRAPILWAERAAQADFEVSDFPTLLCP
jgi:hypothetical protein